MKPSIGILALVIFLSFFWAPTLALAQRFAVEVGHDKLSIANDQLFMCSLDLSLVPLQDLENLWDVTMKDDHRIYLQAADSRYRDWALGYDPTGKDPKVFAAKSGTPGIVKWTINAGTIRAAEGPLKGLYLTPGTEKIEMDVRGKKTVVGTQPVLSKEPKQFHIYEISP